jgi:hypothetical protein
LEKKKKEMRQFQNDEKWEAGQLTDKLEAKRAMSKADWECWKKLEGAAVQNSRLEKKLLFVPRTQKKSGEPAAPLIRRR